jgi:hypothetical protein
MFRKSAVSGTPTGLHGRRKVFSSPPPRDGRIEAAQKNVRELLNLNPNTWWARASRPGAEIAEHGSGDMRSAVLLKPPNPHLLANRMKKMIAFLTADELLVPSGRRGTRLRPSNRFAIQDTAACRFISLSSAKKLGSDRRESSQGRVRTHNNRGSRRATARFIHWNAASFSPSNA